MKRARGKGSGQDGPAAGLSLGSSLRRFFWREQHLASASAGWTTRAPVFHPTGFLNLLIAAPVNEAGCSLHPERKVFFKPEAKIPGYLNSSRATLALHVLPAAHPTLCGMRAQRSDVKLPRPRQQLQPRWPRYPSALSLGVDNLNMVAATVPHNRNLNSLLLQRHPRDLEALGGGDVVFSNACRWSRAPVAAARCLMRRLRPSGIGWPGAQIPSQPANMLGLLWRQPNREKWRTDPFPPPARIPDLQQNEYFPMWRK